MGIMQEPCFVPNYVDSNTTDEEFIKMLEGCLPAAIVARIEEAIDNAADNTEELDDAAAQLREINVSIPTDDEYPVGVKDFEAATISEIREALAEWDRFARGRFEAIESRVNKAVLVLEGE